MKKQFKLLTMMLVLTLLLSGLVVWRSVGAVKIFAQSPNQTDNLPSDLSLDLAFAQKNPAPEAEGINKAETKQVQLVTPSSQITLKPEEALAPEVKSQPADQAVNPQQSTSEQVIVAPVAVNQNETSSPSPLFESSSPQSQPTSQPTSQPNTPQNSANPASSELPQQQQPSPPAPNVQNSSAPANNPPASPNNIPGTSMPEPDDNAAPPEASQQTTPSQPDNNPPPPADDNSAVQGVSTRPSLWQRIVQFFKGR